MNATVSGNTSSDMETCSEPFGISKDAVGELGLEWLNVCSYSISV